ncbi:hypothetical protein [Magnetococcus sp. PR-3]|uniref:hypothetical protein n=1 Tax=Magnetococcus sp. PR-3 TaxID=3120355 RepID=UPI002FCE58AB
MGLHMDAHSTLGDDRYDHCDKRLLRVVSFQRLMRRMGRWSHTDPSNIGSPKDFTQRVHDLREELDLLHEIGLVLPHVANLHNGLHGDPKQFTTFADALELVIDTILGRITTHRANRYKSDDLSAYLELTLKEQRSGYHAENHDRLRILDIRARQLGCVLTAMATMMITPTQWRKLFIYAYGDGGLRRFVHLEAQLTRGKQWIPDYLSRLGIRGDYLLDHYLEHHTSDRFLADTGCRAFLGRITRTGFDDARFLSEVRRVRQTYLHHDHGYREFIMGDEGHWQERVHGGLSGQDWIALVPFDGIKSSKIITQ